MRAEPAIGQRLCDEVASVMTSSTLRRWGRGEPKAKSAASAPKRS